MGPVHFPRQMPAEHMVGPPLQGMQTHQKVTQQHGSPVALTDRGCLSVTKEGRTGDLWVRHRHGCNIVGCRYALTAGQGIALPGGQGGLAGGAGGAKWMANWLDPPTHPPTHVRNVSLK